MNEPGKSKKEPAVLILIGDTTVSGPVKGVFQLMESLKSGPGKYFIVNCQTTRADTGELLKEAGDRGINIQTVVTTPRSYFSLVKKIEHLCLDHDVDIVQTHGYKQSFVGLLVKIRTGLKWVCFLHGTTTENIKTRLYHSIDNFLQRFADNTVIVTRAQRKRLLGGNNSKRVRVVHNAIDLKRPIRRTTNQSVEADQQPQHMGSFLFLVIGRLSPEKGVELFLQALRDVIETTGEDVRAYIVGDGPERQRLERLNSRLSLEKQVVFTGFTPFPGDYLRLADCLVLPSRSEGIPNVVLEAMALEKIVIATAVGGVPEIISHEQHGLLVDSESIDGLAAAMVRIIQEPEVAKRLAENGYLRICEDFSVDSRVNRIRSIYSELLEKPESVEIHSR